MEDADGNPKAGDTLELMKKELKRMKVVENREEPFKKGIATNYVDEDTYYVRNGDDNRSRKDNWKREKYVRSESKPGYLRTASRGNYVRDNSSFRRNSNLRTGSMPGKFTGPPRTNSKTGARIPSRTPERQKSELFKKVENLEKDMKEMKEMLKGKVISGHFVEEDVVIDVNLINDGAARMMLVDCGAPKSVVSREWIEGYLKDMKVDESEIERRSCCRRFRMGETTYLSEIEITFPIVLKTEDGDYIRRKVIAYIIDAERVNFLLGKESIKDLDIMIDVPGERIVFKQKEKKVKTKESAGGHILVNLELVGKWEDSEAILFVEKEDDVKTDSAIKRIHKNLNHKSKEQMIYAYRNTGKLDDGIRKKIIEIVDKCEICKKISKSKPKPAVAIPKATEFNSIVAIDLKVMGEKYILWMICACTRFIQGRVSNYKKPESIVKALHRG